MTTDDSPTYRVPGRPTVYNGIQMRSRLEATYAEWLDTNGIVWHYEPRAYASQLGQYLPDFVLPGIEVAVLRDEAAPALWPVAVEVKPYRWWLLDSGPLLRDEHGERGLTAIGLGWLRILCASTPNMTLAIEIEGLPLVSVFWRERDGTEVVSNARWERFATGMALVPASTWWGPVDPWRADEPGANLSRSRRLV